MRFNRINPWSATAALSLLVVTAALGVHLLLRAFESGTPPRISLLNVALEAAIVSAPIILYSRRQIVRLARSRAEQKEMARRLAVSVTEAEQANRAKSAFLANMSHELRTPLNAIMGFSEVMKDQHLGPVNNARYLGYAADIHASGRYLLGIINDILDLSKIEAGKMSLDDAAEFALADAVAGAIAMVANVAEKFDVRLMVDTPPPGLRLVAVERMVRQILINLVGNAVKFTPAGGNVHVSCGEANGGCRIIVRDTGVGMGHDDILHALTPFGQVANKLSDKHSGTGLGLPLAKAMMELHGGQLAIESRPNQGTRVTLDFPGDRLAAPNKRAAA